MTQHILVTGGNAGIGFALCKQLTYDHGCHVYMGSRSLEKGTAAVKSIMDGLPASCKGKCEVVQLDTSSDESVISAAAVVKPILDAEGVQLYAIVNNAGAGLGHGVAPDVVMNTNLFGPKRVVEAFMPLLSKSGRIVNVGSGAGPMYVRECSDSVKKMLCSPEISWEQIAEHATTGLGSAADRMGGYGLSKALLSSYTMWLAKQHPEILVSCLSPGYIETGMTAGFGGGKKSPEEGTVSIRHCLFEKLDGNGWFYGSDAIRSPLHFLRNPGEPPYKGEPVEWCRNDVKRVGHFHCFSHDDHTAKEKGAFDQMDVQRGSYCSVYIYISHECPWCPPFHGKRKRHEKRISMDIHLSGTAFTL